jgi:hypothetical protein
LREVVGRVANRVAGYTATPWIDDTMARRDGARRRPSVSAA